MSAYFTVLNGVRQGGIMSPLLYNIFMDDLSNLLRKSRVGCFVNNMCLNHLMYADDSVLLAPSPKAFQSLINICEVYALENEITYNVIKTVCMCIKSKRLCDISVSDMLNGKCLIWVVSHKYLGIIIRNDRNDSDNMKRQLQAIYSKGNFIIQKFMRCSDNVKTVLFKAHCVNLYCCQL